MLQSLAKFLYLFKDEDPHQNPGSLPSTHFGTWPLTWMSIFYIYKIAETISIPSTFIKQINACKITLSKVVIYVKEVKDIICLEHHNYFDTIFTNGWETNKYIILDVILKGNLFYSWFLYSATFFCILKTQWLNTVQGKGENSLSFSESTKFSENCSAIPQCDREAEMFLGA